MGYFNGALLQQTQASHLPSPSTNMLLGEVQDGRSAGHVALSLPIKQKQRDSTKFCRIIFVAK